MALLENLSVFDRKRNEGIIDLSRFEKIKSVFYEKLQYLKILLIVDRKIAPIIPCVVKYNFNSDYMPHWTTALSEQPIVDKNDGRFFVCCNNHFVATARKERFITASPETITKLEIGKL